MTGLFSKSDRIRLTRPELHFFDGNMERVLLKWMSGVCGVLALGGAALAAFWIWRMQMPAAPLAPQGEAITWPALQTTHAAAWNVFVNDRLVQAPAAAGPLSTRFRLAGTFMVLEEENAATAVNDPRLRRAIIDERAGKRQHLVAEGDAIGTVSVVEIGQDKVRLREGAQEEELWIAGVPGAATAAAPAATTAVDEGETALEVNRFGKRVADARWVFQREALLSYYQELMDDPERLASVFLSLKPEYKSGKIAGYFLDVEGEGEFFQAVGLHPGDVVRKVNSMNMTSQRRAEYFIGEFVQKRLGAVVMDIERQGKPQKLIYLIR